MVARHTYNTPAHGYGLWSHFSDLSSAGNLQTTVIDRIEVWSAEFINSLMVSFLRLNANSYRR